MFEFFLAYLLMRRPNRTDTDSEWLKSFRSIYQKGSIQDISEEATQHPESAFRHVYLHNERHIQLGLTWKLQSFYVVGTFPYKHLVQSSVSSLQRSNWINVLWRRNKFRYWRYVFQTAEDILYFEGMLDSFFSWYRTIHIQYRSALVLAHT